MHIIDIINEVLWSYVMIAMLLLWAIYFTLATGGVQFRMIGEMCRLLVGGDRPDEAAKAVADAAASEKKKKHVSSFQAFAVSIASRVGTGHLAAVSCTHLTLPTILRV